MLDKIKLLTLKALMSDSELMYGLVLKGGNALQLVYEITDRASMDIDFSIENDFSKFDFERINSILYSLLNDQFHSEGLVVFDINFFEKPKENPIKEWKGYCIDFKISSIENYFPDNIEKTRREAIKINGQSTKFIVDISSYEYTTTKVIKDLHGTILYVYTPEMIVLEKLRALCQSIPEYKAIVESARQKGRARDYYDIWNICKNYKMDFTLKKNLDLLDEIFKSKRVPLEFLDLLPKYSDLQRENWASVEETLTDANEGFDFYYGFVMDLVKSIRNR